jgi:putative peptidoglycan lipid II flippase
VKLGPLTTGRVVTGVAGAAAMIALVNVVSRLVGFGRWLTLAHEVGPTSLGDAYGSANTLPNVLFEVAAGGALASAVVPLLAVPLARAMSRDVDRTASAFLGWSLALLLPIGALVAALARPLVILFMSGGSPEELEVAGRLLAMFAVQIPLYGVGLVLTGVLQAHRRFLAAALAPLLNSLVAIAAFLVFGRMVSDPSVDPSRIPGDALAILGWGTTAGVAVMSLPLLWPVHRAGVRLRPTLRFPEGLAPKARSLALAGIGALVAQQLSVLATLALANRYGPDGTWPVFQYTQAVYVLPYAVLAFPLATATLPRLAEYAAREDTARFARLCAASTRMVVAVSVLGAAMLVAAAPAVEAVFRVVVPAGEVTGMAIGLSWMAPGLLGFALVLHLSRALYSLHRGRDAVTATAAGWLVVAVASTALVVLLTGGERDRIETMRGLGIATTLGMAVAGIGLLVGVQRSAGRDALSGVGRTTGVLAAGGVAGALVGRLCVDAIGGDGWVSALVAAFVGAVAATLTVVATAWLGDRSVLRALREPRADDSVPESLSGDGPVVR